MSAKPEILIRVAVRGFAEGKKLFEDRFCLRDDEIDSDVIQALTDKHIAELVAYPLHMIEFEFLDETDPLERFFRMGTDPTLMTMAIGVSIGEGGFKN